MLNKSKNVVADELLFPATHKFFDNMTREDIVDWANTCMQFVYEDLGYKKNQILHSVIHLDEETPHLHCVVIPLVKKLDIAMNEFEEKIKTPKNIPFNKTHVLVEKETIDSMNNIGNEPTKEATTSEIKEYFDNKDFDMIDVKDISKGTTKEDELFDYAGVPSYLKTSKKSYDDRNKDDYDLSM